MLKSLWHSEKSRFLATGAFNTGFGYAAFVVLYQLLSEHAHYLAIATLAHALSVTVAFSAHRRLVFRSNAPWLGEFVRYNISLAAVFLFGLAGLYVLVDKLAIRPTLAQAEVVVVSTFVSYIAHRHFSFRRRP